MTAAVDGSLDYTLRKASGTVVSNGSNTASARTERHLGDTVVRLKWNFAQQSWGGVAFAFDWRHHSQNQPGAGGFKLQLIGSYNARAVNTHVNVAAYAAACHDQPGGRLCTTIGGIFAAGGVDKAMTKRLTLATDIQMQSVSLQITGTRQTAPVSVAVENSRVQANTATVALTAKFNAWANMLVTFTGLVPANSSGLTDRFTPIIGLDYAW